jgi:hypothetical protein
VIEADFQLRVIQAAQLHGWLVCHFRPARTSKGWRTPVSGDVGFPDLVLARGGAVILAELKTDAVKLRPEQAQWIHALGFHARVWRPRDWPEVLAELSKRKAP